MKFLKWFGIVLSSLVVLMVVLGVVLSESKPKHGKSGEEADKMALKIEESLGKQHWHDIQYVQWTFMGMHHFLWDKHRNFVRVKWNNNTVFIQPGSQKGFVFRDLVKAPEDKTQTMLKAANDLFNNDMFWLVAPFKMFDEGVVREAVNYEGDERLMVTYGNGGTTPGDSYMWKLDEITGRPVSYKMWTQIIPIGGLEATWENWHTFGTGVDISHLHKIGPMGVSVSDVSVGYSFSDMGCEKDPFILFIEKK